MQEIFSGRIRDISSEGHGVVDHPEGRVFFVPGTWPGDEGEFIVESVQKKYGTGRIHKLTISSASRRDSPCPHFGLQPGACGGCPWIIVDVEAQLQQKQKRIEYLIQRNEMTKDSSVIKQIVGSPKEFGYRNRAQFKTDGKKIGYVSPKTKKIAAIEDCIILTDKNRQTFKDLKAQLPNREWAPSGSYLWNYLDIDEDVSAKDVMINHRRPFRQGNNEQNEFMKSWVRQKIQGLGKNNPVVELFSGSGNFTTVFVEGGFTQIYSAEIDQKAVQNLRSNKWPGVQGFVVDLFRPAQWTKIPNEIRKAEVLFLDPPREGFSLLEEFIENFNELKTIVYVSCEPYQWAADIKKLIAKKWKLLEVQPLDQFPHTPHIELLSVLTR